MNEIRAEIKRRKTYAGVNQDLLNKVNQIANQYPGAKDLVIDLIANYIKEHQQPNNLINDLWSAVDLLKQEFGTINDEDLIRSLCYHYSAEEGDRRPTELLSLLGSLSRFNLDHKNLLLRIVSVSLNNEKFFTTSEFNQLIQLCQDPQHGNELLNKLEQFYQFAPYPSVGQIIEWHERALATEDYASTLSDIYVKFDKNPCKREPENGFELKDAVIKAKEFGGVEFTKEELVELDRQSKFAHSKSTTELREEFKQFKGEKAPNYPKLIAIAAVLLHRAKGKDGRKGSSFEINTTQYLDIFACLKVGDHNTAEIATGEGKSRIMAILNACRLGLGKSVDFVTSDMELATRDYLEFLAFYNLAEGKTNIIHADSPISSYLIGGINYSDASNLQLFRNKARSIGRGAEVIDPNPKNRVLHLDEADKTFFDVAERYNFSMQGDEKIKDMEWVYPLLVEFFEGESNRDLYYSDIDQTNKKFIDFASSKLAPEQLAKLKALPGAQLETWHDSAMQARTLVFGQHFVIEPDASIMTPLGPKIASEARLRNEKDGRIAKSSKFSSGVHQCLHARLNRLKLYPNKAEPKEEALIKKLKECKQPFHLDPEKQIIYSSTSKNLLNDYDQGELTGVTGSAGLIIEKTEATSFYSNMQFISTPRHNGLQREDRPVRLIADSEAQIDALVEYIQEARRLNQPVLIICENDKKSEKMFELINKALENKQPLGGLQRIHSQLTSNAEKDALRAAGTAGFVTVSTPMIGRGTDIKLDENAKIHGLKMLVTYLPRERDMKQLFGRAGRFGDKGDARLVLNKKNVKKRLGKDSLNDGFYTAPENYLLEQQTRLDKEAQRDRLIAHTINDFSKRLNDKFFKFKDQSPPAYHESLIRAWTKFTKEKDQLWDSEFKQKILAKMNETTPNFDRINIDLAQFSRKTQILWDELYSKINQLDSDILTDPTLKQIGELQLSENTKSLVQEVSTRPVELKTPVYEKYDPAHDGRAVLYTRPFEKLRAFFAGERNFFADFKAWYNGHGILFPNLRAWWNGHMSFGEYLFGASSDSAAEVEQVAVQSEDIEEDIFNSVTMAKRLLANKDETEVAHIANSNENTQNIELKENTQIDEQENNTEIDEDGKNQRVSQ